MLFQQKRRLRRGVWGEGRKCGPCASSDEEGAESPGAGGSVSTPAGMRQRVVLSSGSHYRCPLCCSTTDEMWQAPRPRSEPREFPESCRKGRRKTPTVAFVTGSSSDGPSAAHPAAVCSHPPASGIDASLLVDWLPSLGSRVHRDPECGLTDGCGGLDTLPCPLHTHISGNSDASPEPPVETEPLRGTGLSAAHWSPFHSVTGFFPWNVS